MIATKGDVTKQFTKLFFEVKKKKKITLRFPVWKYLVRLPLRNLIVEARNCGNRYIYLYDYMYGYIFTNIEIKFHKQLRIDKTIYIAIIHV